MRPARRRGAHRARPATDRSGRHVRAARAAPAPGRRHDHRRATWRATCRRSSACCSRRRSSMASTPKRSAVLPATRRCERRHSTECSTTCSNTWESTGLREFILLTAHEHDPHLEALSTVITNGARVRVVDIFGLNFEDLLEGQSEPMHGDEVDTSLLLYIAPELVNMELAQDYMMSRDELRRYRRGWLRVPRARVPARSAGPRWRPPKRAARCTSGSIPGSATASSWPRRPNHEPSSPAGVR